MLSFFVWLGRHRWGRARGTTGRSCKNCSISFLNLILKYIASLVNEQLFFFYRDLEVFLAPKDVPDPSETRSVNLSISVKCFEYQAPVKCSWPSSFVSCLVFTGSPRAGGCVRTQRKRCEYCLRWCCEHQIWYTSFWLWVHFMNFLLSFRDWLEPPAPPDSQEPPGP